MSGVDLNQIEQGVINWSDPIPLGEFLPPVPPFDLRVLPKMVRRCVEDVAERMCCPLDFPAIAAIVTIGSAIGAQINVRVDPFGTWYVPSNVWGMLVSPPSAIKSPPVTEMIFALKNLDRTAAADYAEAVRRYDILKTAHEVEVKKLAKTDPQAALDLEPPMEPQMRRYLVNDSTYEMLVAIAASNPQGFLIYRDELVGWFHSMNKDNQKEARGLYLTGWSGTEGYATDRIGRGHTRAERVCLSLIGTIQPNVLRSVVYDAVTGGVGDDGLVARFQLAVYPDPVREWKKVLRHTDIEAFCWLEELIKRLSNLDQKIIGAQIAPNGLAFLVFDNEAQAVFDGWRAGLETRLRSDNSDEHPVMLAHLGKFRSLVPKLALIFHLADGGVGDITKKAIARAILLAHYLEAHARRIYHTATNRSRQSAIALVNKIKAGRLRDGFTRSDVLTSEWAGLRTADEINAALTVLVDFNWIVAIQDRGTGGRPAEHFYLNPKIKQS